MGRGAFTTATPDVPLGSTAEQLTNLVAEAVGLPAGDVSISASWTDANEVTHEAGGAHDPMSQLLNQASAAVTAGQPGAVGGNMLEQLEVRRDMVCMLCRLSQAEGECSSVPRLMHGVSYPYPVNSNFETQCSFRVPHRQPCMSVSAAQKSVHWINPSLVINALVNVHSTQRCEMRASIVGLALHHPL